MIPDFSRPFSAFTHGDKNPASFIIGQHYEARDQAIKDLVNSYHKGIDIEDPEIFYAILNNHGLLDDEFQSEEEYIIQEVGKRIR